jgi:hypothetical protein
MNENQTSRVDMHVHSTASELTTSFKGELQAVHVLCYGLTHAGAAGLELPDRAALLTSSAQ